MWHLLSDHLADSNCRGAAIGANVNGVPYALSYTDYGEGRMTVKVGLLPARQIACQGKHHTLVLPCRSLG